MEYPASTHASAEAASSAAVWPTSVPDQAPPLFYSRFLSLPAELIKPNGFLKQHSIASTVARVDINDGPFVLNLKRFATDVAQRTAFAGFEHWKTETDGPREPIQAVCDRLGAYASVIWGLCFEEASNDDVCCALRVLPAILDMKKIRVLLCKNSVTSLQLFPADVFTNVTHISFADVVSRDIGATIGWEHAKKLAHGRRIDLCGSYVPQELLGMVPECCFNFGVECHSHEVWSPRRKESALIDRDWLGHELNRFTGLTFVAPLIRTREEIKIALFEKSDDATVKRSVPDLKAVVIRAMWVMNAAEAETVFTMLQCDAPTPYWLYFPGTRDWTQEDKNRVERAFVALRARSKATKIVLVAGARPLTKEEIQDCPRLENESDVFACTIGGNGWRSRYTVIV